MGYSHHWHRPPSLQPKPWAAFIADAEAIVRAVVARGIRLGGSCDEPGSLPALTPEFLVLNGAGAETLEDFCILRQVTDLRRLTPDGKLFGHCKTEGRRYDLAVTACLLAARHRFGEPFEVITDGDQTGWLPAIDLCRELFHWDREYAINRRRVVPRSAPATAERTPMRAEVVVLREFPTVAERYRARVLRTSASPRGKCILDLREWVQGSSFSGYTRRGIKLSSMAEVRALREILQAIEAENLLT